MGTAPDDTEVTAINKGPPITRRAFVVSVPETTFFRDLCVNLRIRLCGTSAQASAQRPDLPDPANNFWFLNQKFAY
jgi:hypothetical protein